MSNRGRLVVLAAILSLMLMVTSEGQHIGLVPAGGAVIAPTSGGCAPGWTAETVRGIGICRTDSSRLLFPGSALFSGASGCAPQSTAGTLDSQAICRFNTPSLVPLGNEFFAGTEGCGPTYTPVTTRFPNIFPAHRHTNTLTVNVGVSPTDFNYVLNHTHTGVDGGISGPSSQIGPVPNPTVIGDMVFTFAGTQAATKMLPSTDTHNHCNWVSAEVAFPQGGHHIHPRGTTASDHPGGYLVEGMQPSLNVCMGTGATTGIGSARFTDGHTHSQGLSVYAGPTGLNFTHSHTGLNPATGGGFTITVRRASSNAGSPSASIASVPGSPTPPVDELPEQPTCR